MQLASGDVRLLPQHPQQIVVEVVFGFAELLESAAAAAAAAAADAAAAAAAAAAGAGAEIGRAHV